MNKNVLAVCVLTLLCFLSCHMALLDRLIGVVSERFSEEEYYLGLLKESKEGEEDQSDVIIKAGKKFKVLGVVGIPKKGVTQQLQPVSQVGAALNQDQNKNLIINPIQSNSISSYISSPGSGLEGEKKAYEDGISTTTVNQQSLEQQPVEKQAEDSKTMVKQQGNEGEQRPEVVIETPQSDQPQRAAESQTVELMQGEQNEQSSVQDTESERIKDEIKSNLGQINTLSSGLKKILSELEGYESFVSKEKSNAENLDQEVKKVLDKIVVQIVKKDGIVDLNQFMEKSSKNIIKNINIAKALYQELVDILEKVKVEAESAKNSIDSSDMLKVKDRLNGAIEEIISGNKGLSAKSARSKVSKEYKLFQELSMNVEMIRDVISAGSYDKIPAKWRRYSQEFINKTTEELYTKINKDAELGVKNVLYKILTIF
ncbi:hypothetical protein bcCo53_001451 (plasmid) [Borrelia coriaceae]|uniref:Uncharacterized protein n=1 Tax=Borrelia coriaceae ATCC 43381 TaxID=1408429 RepID=W5T3K7_9SPIR|nr:hypothetical protein [Borrelia coriaceae]AHH11871.1 hypothetical protein BCO_0900151 [Borrelia coriaceae ATCC 43381]UPA17273.1 hypothetical protein bcCo53_001451 [Borrelia coriaceae]